VGAEEPIVAEHTAT